MNATSAASTSHIRKPERLAGGSARADVERVIESAIGGTPSARRSKDATLHDQRAIPGAISAATGCPPASPRSDRPGGASVAVGRRRNGERSGHGHQGSLWPPMGSHGIVLARTWTHGGGAPMGGSGPPRLTLPSGRASCRTRRRMVMGARREHGRCAVAMGGGAMPGGGIPSATTPEVPGQPSCRFGEIADIRIAGGPPMVRGRGGAAGRLLLCGHRPGPARYRRLLNEAKEVVAARWPTAAEVARRHVPQVTASTSSSRRWRRA